MLKGHAVTLTFKVATQMLRATRRVNMVINYTNNCKIRLLITKLFAGHDFAEGHVVTWTFKVAAQMLQTTRRLNMAIITV